ncbi:endonuclease III [Achromobacter insuavis]
MLLSAQATDKSVNIATRKFFPRYGTPQALLALGEEGLADYIKTIGLFRTKAKNAIATCRLLIEQHGGEVPQTREALEALPGVGRKTANVVLNTAFGQPTMAVDTHIFRVSNRTGIAPGKNVLEVEPQTREIRAARIYAGRAPLADSAGPLRVRGAQTEMPAMRYFRPVRIQGQDAGLKRLARCAISARQYIAHR